MTLRQNTSLAKKATRKGYIVCFLDDGRIGTYEEDDITGKKEIDEIVDVKWKKDNFKARIIFIDTFDNATKEEKRLLHELKQGHLIADQQNGTLVPQQKPTPGTKRKRKLILYKDKEDTEKVDKGGVKKVKTSKKETSKKGTSKKGTSKNETSKNKTKDDDKKGKKNPKKSKEDFEVDVVHVEDSTSDSTESLQVSEDSNPHSPRKKLSISFSDDESLDNMTKMMQKVLPKFKKKDKKLPTNGVEKTFATHVKNQDETTVTPKEKTKRDTINDIQSEEIKILSRDVKILKQDCAKLRHRVDTLESTLFSTSTPRKDCQQMAQDNSSRYGISQRNLLADQYYEDSPITTQHWSDKTACRQFDKEQMERPHRKDFYRLEAYSPSIDRQSEYYSMDDKYKTTQRSFGYYEGKSAYNTNWYEESEGSKQYKSFAEYDDEYQRDLLDKKRKANSKPDTEYYSTQQSSRESVSSPTLLTDSLSLLQNRSYLESIKAKSSSIQNFAAKLNSEIFTRHERRTSNVSGLQNKPRLDEKKIKAIRDTTFSVYPVEVHKQDAVWKDCKKAIDSMNRKLKDPLDSD